MIVIHSNHYNPYPSTIYIVYIILINSILSWTRVTSPWTRVTSSARVKLVFYQCITWIRAGFFLTLRIQEDHPIISFAVSENDRFILINVGTQVWPSLVLVTTHFFYNCSGESVKSLFKWTHDDIESLQMNTW